jgi:hypothetical protein
LSGCNAATAGKTAVFFGGMADACLPDGRPTCVSNLASEPLEPLAKELLIYWLQHSAKFGTLESIVEWWLLEHRIQQAALEVRAVLEKLVATGIVVQWQEADGRDYFRLNRDRKDEIRAWIESGSRMES